LFSATQAVGSYPTACDVFQGREAGSFVPL